MLNQKAQWIHWLGVFIIVAGLFVGFFLGRIDLGYTDKQAWPITLTFWVSGLVSGTFFIALAEIIEQLYKMNLKLSQEPDESDLKLLND